MTFVKSEISLRDLIYIGTLIIAGTVTIMNIQAMTRANRASAEQQRETNIKLERILENHEGRITNLEVDSARTEAFRNGFEAGKASQ